MRRTVGFGFIAGAVAFSGVMPESEDMAIKKAGSAMANVNVCEGKKIPLENAACILDTIREQAARDVTVGHEGEFETDVVPITSSYLQAGLCPVNVHWHLGAEHRSEGEYDENGSGPAYEDYEEGSEGNLSHRRLLASRQGMRCHHYDAQDEKFTKPYAWKYCTHMDVGETYEVHWPHSAAGACGTVNQYQTPFYDGVFCNLDMETLLTLKPQDIASAVGVQAQVFTIVNDEDYYYPNLMQGWILDGDKGADIAKYTGSTTGDSRDNTICSAYSPITWQVDRKCHLISASSFDKMCADMLSQRDDMSGDVHPHGSRELVADSHAANNLQR
jgi:hypothetical protein